MLVLDKERGYYKTVCGTYQVYYSKYNLSGTSAWAASPQRGQNKYIVFYAYTLEDLERQIKERYPHLATEAWINLHS